MWTQFPSESCLVQIWSAHESHFSAFNFAVGSNLNPTCEFANLNPLAFLGRWTSNFSRLQIDFKFEVWRLQIWSLDFNFEVSGDLKFEVYFKFEVQTSVQAGCKSHTLGSGPNCMEFKIFAASAILCQTWGLGWWFYTIRSRVAFSTLKGKIPKRCSSPGEAPKLWPQISR